MAGIDYRRRAEGRGWKDPARVRRGWLGFGADNRKLEQQIKSMANGQQGRKAIREASKAALQIFNKETGKNAAALPLKESGKGWRKLLLKDKAYKYKASAHSTGYFSAVTGINYKHAALRISHLVEMGFRHFHAGKVTARRFRAEAFKTEKPKVMRRFSENLTWAYEQISKTGKAPTASKMRKRFNQ